MTERSTLERKRLSDLHQIASQLGIKQYRKYRKPELAEMIYKVATEQAASQQNETTTNGGAAATATQEAPVTTEDPNGATETPVAAPLAREGEKYPAMVRIETVNGQEPQKGRWRPNFDDLTPLYPLERLRLEWKPNDIAPRVIDLVA